jgi:hypothetical protein
LDIYFLLCKTMKFLKYLKDKTISKFSLFARVVLDS